MTLATILLTPLEYKHLTLDELCLLPHLLDSYLNEVAVTLASPVESVKEYTINVHFSNPDWEERSKPRVSLFSLFFGLAAQKHEISSEDATLFDGELGDLTQRLMAATTGSLEGYTGLRNNRPRHGSVILVSNNWSPDSVVRVLQTIVPPFMYSSYVPPEKDPALVGPFLVRYRAVPQDLYLRALSLLPEEKSTATQHD